MKEDNIQVWRMQMKPEPAKGISYDDVLKFCMGNQIIGIGWTSIKGRKEDYCTIQDEISKIPAYSSTAKDATAALKAVNALMSMKTGDLIWTRVGGRASDYYLCRVGDKTWKDGIATEAHISHDIGNYVSATWLHVGTVDNVPGKVVNSFIAAAAAQRVYGVEMISKIIWNNLSPDDSYKYTVQGKRIDCFWSTIGSEELECLVLLYLQHLGYYVYSSSIKKSTATFEAVLVSSDGMHHAFPQVKREEPLRPSAYVQGLQSTDKVFLFTTSENYCNETHPQVTCITKAEIEAFVKSNMGLLPTTIKRLLI